MAAMHAVWMIAELRLSVFEYLDVQDLARLAQTCSTLCELAADELWRTVTSPEQLVSCLPEDFRLRPLRTEDIQRLDHYACKVESICWENDGGGVIRLPKQFLAKRRKRRQRVKNGKTWEELWKEIGRLRPSSQFLPNLRCLRIHSVIEELLWAFVGISGQKLARIDINVIHYPEPERVVTKLLDSFQTVAKLEYLFVRDGEPDLVPSNLLRQAPLKQLRLEPRVNEKPRVHLPIRVEILHKSVLEHLTLALKARWYPPEIGASNEKYFPALRTLRLDLTNYTPLIDTEWKPRYDYHEEELKRSPSVFFQLLDNPELDLLNIKFPLDANGLHFLEVVSAARSNCRLRNLQELALAGGGWIPHCSECGQHPEPEIRPPELRQAMSMLLPLPQLKVLRISIAPNFLDIFDPDLYKSFTDGLPALEKLHLGHKHFVSTSYFDGTAIFERVPLLHLAAFCSMLPNLVEASVGCAAVLEEKPQLQWACLTVGKLTISHWVEPTLSEERVLLNLRGYFPNSDLAMDCEGIDSDELYHL